jgi:t-SNARE complex subunit (syntaxin)
MANLNIYFTTMFDHIFKLFNDDHHQLQIKHKKLATDHVEELHQKHLQIMKLEKELQTLRHSLDYYKKEADGLKTLVQAKISDIVKSMVKPGILSWNKKKLMTTL